MNPIVLLSDPPLSSMKRVLTSPSKYIQGPGSLSKIGEDLKSLTSQNAVFILGGTTSLKAVERVLLRTLREVGIKVTDVQRGINTCTWEEIDRLTDLAKDSSADLTLGVGGGTALDTAKVVARQAGTKLANLPVIASNDSPCSAVSIIYNEKGCFIEAITHPKNPDLVIVDTRIITSAPTNFLVDGMGDALATRFEAEATFKSLSKTRAGGETSKAALHLARLCYSNLVKYGKQAKIACEHNAVTPALETIIETNILLSGMGFESGGLAAAHAIEKAFTKKVSVKASHGRVVAFGTITQLILEDKPPKLLQEVLGFCREIGLPTTLRELGIDCEEDQKKKLAYSISKEACKEGSSIYNEPVDITVQNLSDAILTADAWGEECKED